MIEGILHKTTTGRWATCRSGQSPIEITSGCGFWIEVNGKLKLTTMEYRHFLDGGEEYYSVDAYELCDGLRATQAF